MLKDCAHKTGLPIILAAQFNRNVTAEADLSPVNIRESADIEQIASLIVGMFNRNFTTMSRTGNIGKDGKVKEKESVIYFEILKGRNVGSGHSSIMDFDGNKGLILKAQADDTLKNETSSSSRDNTQKEYSDPLIASILGTQVNE